METTTKFHIINSLMKYWQHAQNEVPVSSLEHGIERKDADEKQEDQRDHQLNRKEGETRFMPIDLLG